MANCFAEFLQNAGLYDSIDINIANIAELCDLIGGKVKISEYCKECKETRVFSMEAINFLIELDHGEPCFRELAEELTSIQECQKAKNLPIPGERKEHKEWTWTNWQTEDATRIMIFPFVCAMDEKHHLDYIVRTDGCSMVKIGQFPSIADISFPELKEFNKEIDNQSLKEFRRAIGLHAQGIGVGSYVYLRRIFERILEEAKNHAKNEGVVDLSGYETMRVPEKIKILKDYLPDIISSNAKIYGIVSKGIHELSEEECINYFPVLQEALFLILRQWSQKRKEKETIQKIEASLSVIATEIS